MTDVASKPGTSREASDKSIEARVSTSESREVLVSMYVRGSTNDAKVLYGASMGATDAGWQALERMLSPVKQFIESGGMPYNYALPTTEYAGIPTPEPEAVEENPGPEATRSRGEYSAGRAPGNLSADVEAETKHRTGQSLDKNPGTVTSKSKDEEDDEDAPPEAYSAKELAAQAESAKDAKELDRVERLAAGRTTVLDAVSDRRKKLGIK